MYLSNILCQCFLSFGINLNGIINLRWATPVPEESSCFKTSLYCQYFKMCLVGRKGHTVIMNASWSMMWTALHFKVIPRQYLFFQTYLTNKVKPPERSVGIDMDCQSRECDFEPKLGKHSFTKGLLTLSLIYTLSDASAADSFLKT